MRVLILFALFSLGAAKPGGLVSGWGDPHGGISSVSLVQQPVAVAQPVLQQYVAQPVVHAAPVAIAKSAATSYSSFQRVIHPVAVAQPVVHAVSQPLVQVSQPVVHAAPVIQQPILQSYAQPVVHAAPVLQQPILQSYAQPVVQAAPVIQQPILQSYAQPAVSKVVSVGSYGGYGSYGRGW